MSSKQNYPQDKQPGDRPPAYPNQAYHPPSQRRHVAVNGFAYRFCPDPPYNSRQYQSQPQPQVIHVERRKDRGDKAGLCAAAWSVLVI